LSYVTDVLKNNRVFAVVGATPNKEKYGYKIFAALREGNYQVFPVNPKYETVDEAPCYPSLKELPTKPQVVVTVVPAEVTIKVVEECRLLGVPIVWMPPGSWSEEAISKAESYGLKVIHDICIIYSLKSLTLI
jgi:predicted CoA-binding protein